MMLGSSSLGPDLPLMGGLDSAFLWKELVQSITGNLTHTTILPDDNRCSGLLGHAQDFLGGQAKGSLDL
jgi:hypothetical protein